MLCGEPGPFKQPEDNKHKGVLWRGPGPNLASPYSISLERLIS